MQKLLALLSSNALKPAELPGKIPAGFFADKYNRYVMMEFFDNNAKFECQKEDWRDRADADEIAMILRKNTVAYGHGILKLQTLGALSDVLTDESFEAIEAFKTVLNMMFKEMGMDDFNFWIQFSHRFRDCKMKEIFWPTLMRMAFSDEQKARLLAKRKYLVYMPEELRTPVFMEAFKRIAGQPTKSERKGKIPTV